jgi:hypothetical protein
MLLRVVHSPLEKLAKGDFSISTYLTVKIYGFT